MATSIDSSHLDVERNGDGEALARASDGEGCRVGIAAGVRVRRVQAGSGAAVAEGPLEGVRVAGEAVAERRGGELDRLTDPASAARRRTGAAGGAVVGVNVPLIHPRRARVGLLAAFQAHRL